MTSAERETMPRARAWLPHGGCSVTRGDGAPLPDAEEEVCKDEEEEEQPTLLPPASALPRPPRLPRPRPPPPPPPLVASARISQSLIAPSVAPALTSFALATSSPRKRIDETLAGVGWPERRRFKAAPAGGACTSASMVTGRSCVRRASQMHTVPSRAPDANTCASSDATALTEPRCP